MTTDLIDLGKAKQATADDLPGLQVYLTQLVGEPFRLQRVSYGDELTLHFGNLRAGRSPKRDKQMYGAYILGLRASPWLLKSGEQPLVLSAGIVHHPVSTDVAEPLAKDDFEESWIIQPDSRVLTATVFVVKPADAFGLQLQTADGSTLLVLPTVCDDQDDDEELPEIADWELLSPNGLLNAGPGLNWSFEPTVK